MVSKIGFLKKIAYMLNDSSTLEIVLILRQRSRITANYILSI